MPISVTHVLTATTPDDLAYEIRPSHWNSSHAVTLAAVGSEISNAFSNSPTVSFGMSGTRLTASAAGGGGGALTFSAGTSSGSLGSIVFSNSNGVSFGLNGSTITASALGAAGSGFTTTSTGGAVVAGTLDSSGLKLAVPSYLTTAMLSNAVTLSNINVSAGSTSSNLSAVTFSNGSGVSFGLNGGVITASVGAAGGGLTNINVSAGTTSNLMSAMTFSNTNGVSFGLAGSVLTGSIDITSSVVAGSNVSLSTAGSTITIAAGLLVSAGTLSAVVSQLTFSNSNGISFGMNGSIITASGGSGGGGGVAISAGTQSASTNTVVFSNSNGLSFGMSNSSIITGSYTVPASSSLVGGANITISTAGSTITIIGGAGANINFSAGTTSSNLGSVIFSNSNNISFGLSAGSLITGSANAAGTGFTTTTIAGSVVAGTHDTAGLKLAVPAYLTVQTNQSAIGAVGVTNTGNTAGNVGFSTGVSYAIAASGLLTMSQSTAAGGVTGWIQHPAWLTTAMQSASSANFAATGFTTTATAGTAVVGTHDTAGLKLGVPPFITTAAVSTVGLYAVGNTTSASSTTLNPQTLSFAGSGGATVGFNAGSVIISAPVSTEGYYAVGNTTSASSTTLNPQTLSINALGGMTAGFNAGSLILSAPVSTEGFYAVGNTTSASSTTIDPRTFSINALGAITAGFNAGSLILSGPASSSLVGTGGISISSAGSTITIAKETVNYALFPVDAHWTNVTAPGNGSMSIQFIQNQQHLTATRLDALFNWSAATAATTATAAIFLTAYAGIYTRNGSTLSSLSGGSSQTTYTYASNSANTVIPQNAIKPISVPINVDMKPGNYYVAFGWSSSAGSIGLSTTALGQTQSVLGVAGILSATNYGEWGTATATSANWFNSGGMGVYSVATASSLTGISLSGINMTGANLAAADIGLIFRG